MATPILLSNTFFDRDAQLVAQELLGKVLYRFYAKKWLCAQIMETEAYYITEKGSHASLGFTPKRRALFMPAGTIYMYYARGGDFECEWRQDRVLLKSSAESYLQGTIQVPVS